MPKRVASKTHMAQKLRYYRKNRKYAVPRPWDRASDDAVLRHEVRDVVLAKALRRSVGAIQVRRNFLKHA